VRDATNGTNRLTEPGGAYATSSQGARCGPETVDPGSESSVGHFVSALRYDMRVETAQEFLAALKA